MVSLRCSKVLLSFFKPASDATQIFEETKHSVEAREMMQAFFVGIFVEVSKIIYNNLHTVKNLTISPFRFCQFVHVM